MSHEEGRAYSSGNSSGNKMHPNHRSSSASTGSSSTQSLTIGYRSSSSSSSTASSGKQLVKPHQQSPNIYGLHDRNYPPTDGVPPGSRPSHRPQHQHKRTSNQWQNEPASSPSSVYSSSSSSSPETHKKAPPKFYIGPPSTASSSSEPPSPLRLSPLPAPEVPTSPTKAGADHLKSPQFLYPGYLHPDHPRLSPPTKGSLYDGYWHIPRATLWCSQKGCGEQNQKCSKCQLKEETTSTCSSVNPPPTFTAMDNYQPIRRRPNKCSCGAIFAATTVLSTLILLLIGAFILYIEMVLKRTEYIPDPM